MIIINLNFIFHLSLTFQAYTILNNSNLNRLFKKMFFITYCDFYLPFNKL